MKKQCGTCRFWYEDESYRTPGAVGQGECRGREARVVGKNVKGGEGLPDGLVWTWTCETFSCDFYEPVERDGDA